MLIYKVIKMLAIVFCFDNCAAKSEDKFVLVWLKCCPSYRSRKKGIEGKFFEAEAVGRGWEMFPRFPFFYWSNLDNTEIRLGPNLYERRGKHNYWNRILFSFVWLFRKHSTPHSIFLNTLSNKLLSFQEFHWK